MKKLKLSKSIAFIALVLLLVIFGLGFLVSKLLKPSIPVNFISSSPVDKSTKFDPFEEIIVEFSGVTIKNQTNITYKIFPNIQTSATWKSEQILEIFPQVIFSPFTEYTVVFLYEDHPIKEITFTTKSYQEMSNTEQLQLQSLYDLQYSEDQKKIYKNKPWLSKLPIDNDQYVAVDDPQNNSIYVRIKTSTGDISTLQKQIQNQLISIGVPQYYKIDWVLP